MELSILGYLREDLNCAVESNPKTIYVNYKVTWSYFKFSMVALAKLVIFEYLMFFLSSSACAHKISRSKLESFGLVNS